MKKILILADQPNWCFGRRARAIREYAPSGWDVRIEYFGIRPLPEIAYESADAVFVLDPKKSKPLREIFQVRDIRVPLIASHNSGPGRPGYGIDETLCAADYVIVNNHAAWAANAYGQRDYRACNISNGVDTRVFFSEIPWGERPNRALWIGSDSKSADDDDVKRYRAVLSPLSRVLEPAAGISTDFRTVATHTALDDAGMRAFYNSGRYLVCASKTEGTPNIALEGAACGCVVVSTPVGNIPELITDGVNGKIVYRPDTIGFMDVFEQTPAAEFEKMSQLIRGTIAGWDWKYRVPFYYQIFEALIEGRRFAPFSYLNGRLGAGEK
jgi:hypothetical protein